MSNASPILSGLRLRCGKCGEGKLFSGYLKLNSECPVCGRDMTSADTADGPAFFVGFGVLILLAPFLFLLPMSPLPTGLKILSFVALCIVLIGLCMILLPVAKAVLLNLQLHHGAEEVTASDIKDR
ncbi:MAG: DUF983 domain-containing protein [Hyphomonas oceanitis]|uniref:DUF983 domain-containing protein n=1 Tax=Hyphomonas oceanitis TaxID=81033 RepID=UPI003001FAD3